MNLLSSILPLIKKFRDIFSIYWNNSNQLDLESKLPEINDDITS